MGSLEEGFRLPVPALLQEAEDRSQGACREIQGLGFCSLARYRDLPLGFADAAVVAMAERNGGLVLSLDRHFHMVAQEGTIRVLP